MESQGRPCGGVFLQEAVLTQAHLTLGLALFFLLLIDSNSASYGLILKFSSALKTRAWLYVSQGS